MLAQLDRVQDSLRLKAVNRPLTYALKDFSLDLQVFAEIDARGEVRFRPASANEVGASTLKLGFTTITKPMIEENTVSMAASKSPTLDELGLDADEAKRLESLGVRTAAQLHRLQREAGQPALARLSGVNLDRLRAAIARGRPVVKRVEVIPTNPSLPPVKAPTKPPIKTEHAPTTPPIARPDIVRPDIVRPRSGMSPLVMPPRTAPVMPSPVMGARPGFVPLPASSTPAGAAPAPRLRLAGDNFLGGGAVPRVKLGDRMLTVERLEEGDLEVSLPAGVTSGSLAIDFGDDDVQTFELDLDALHQGALDARTHDVDGALDENQDAQHGAFDEQDRALAQAFSGASTQANLGPAGDGGNGRRVVDDPWGPL